MIRVISGHACAGKTTYVREHATPRAVVVDFDAIASALSPLGEPTHDHTERRRAVALSAWVHLVEHCLREHRAESFELWIIHAYPEAWQVEKYHRSGASIKELMAPADVLLARATAERPPETVAMLRERLGVG